MTTIAELLGHREQLVRQSQTPALDTEMLLSHCLQQSRTYLFTWPERSVPEDTEQQFLRLLARRQEGEPIAYLTGKRGFWSIDLAVSPATLIPRPETELLVEKSIDLLVGSQQPSVLDLGTGTGAIALALAGEHAHWQLQACDVEPAAVALAELNRQQLKLNNVTIFQSNWYDSVECHQFDLIVSNPPYIDLDDPHLQQGDVRYEPHSALVADKQGLADIEIIICGAARFLKAGGWLLLEHGYNQAEQVRGLLHQAGFDQVFTDRDLAGNDRISGGYWQKGWSDE